MRVFRDCEEMIREMDREILQSGISVPLKHYQNQVLSGEDSITKELMGVAFTISKPLEKRREMIKHIFGDDTDRIEKYCIQEFADRTCGEPLNPGNSYKIRLDLWQKMMSKVEGEKFDYTYPERFCRFDQIDNVISLLTEDKHSRQAMMHIWHPDLDVGRGAGQTRVPCSIDYQFMIRNNRLYVIYHMRSSDILGHLPIDIWLTAELMKYVADKLKENGTSDLKYGSLLYFAGSLHAYAWNLRQRVIF